MLGVDASPEVLGGAGGRQTASVGDDHGTVVTLRDGAPVRLRPIRPDDEKRLLALAERLSPRTVYQRFFSVRRLRPEDARALVDVDYRERMAIVAEVDAEETTELIGVARYAPSGEPFTVEIALVVEDRWQGLGLGSILLDEILRAAAARGIHRFTADVLTENRRMLRLLSGHTVITNHTTSDGVTTLVFHPKENGELHA